MGPLPWWGTCCNGTPKKDLPLCRYTTASNDSGYREDSCVRQCFNVLITVLLLLFSIAWCSTSGGAACVTQRDCHRVVRYNLLSRKTVKLPWGSNIAGIFQAGVTMRFHYLLIQVSTSTGNPLQKKHLMCILDTQSNINSLNDFSPPPKKQIYAVNHCLLLHF